MKMIVSTEFDHIIRGLTFALANAPVVQVGEWQAVLAANDPKSMTIEAEDLSIQWDPPENTIDLVDAVKPNLPWAEEHFLERVSGHPLNPPPSHVRWPYAQKENTEFAAFGQFSHTYPERMWAASVPNTHGIRYAFGDLGDLVKLLRTRPLTRQAYLPIWFPEDLDAAAEYGQRVPCSLGYHFMIRDGRLKCVYYIRSCDFYRHFRDDVYMAVRLQQWVAGQVGARVGRFVMHMSSLHIFAAEQDLVKAAAQEFMMGATRW